jgi:hypothetical protein
LLFVVGGFWMIATVDSPLIGLNDQPQTTNHKQQTACVTNKKPQKLQARRRNSIYLCFIHSNVEVFRFPGVLSEALSQRRLR